MATVLLGNPSVPDGLRHNSGIALDRAGQTYRISYLRTDGRRGPPSRLAPGRSSAR